jgi:hypothetical protein
MIVEQRVRDKMNWFSATLGERQGKHVHKIMKHKIIAPGSRAPSGFLCLDDFVPHDFVDVRELSLAIVPTSAGNLWPLVRGILR